MTQQNDIPRVYYLFDISQSMNKTQGIIWPFCKFVRGRTHGEHALDICRTCRQSSPNYIHRYFISFQGDLDENPTHPLTLEEIENKYQNSSRPRHRSNIIQRLHNILQIMKAEAQNRPNSTSRLLIFSDGEDNKSTKALKDLHQQEMNELQSSGISIVVINFGTTGLGFPDAVHYNSDDFPPGNMDEQVTNMLRSDVPRIINSSNRSRGNSQSNIHTLNDTQVSVEENQYQHNSIYVRA